MWHREDEIETLLRESAEGYLSTHHSLDRFRNCRRTDCGFDMQFWSNMGDLGWTGILLPAVVGGAELGLGPALTLAEAFGKHLVPEPFVATAVIAGTVLAASGSPRTASLASELSAGRAVVLLADQEEAGIVSPSPPRTRVEQRGDRLLLSGSKTFLPSWTPDAHVIVTALLDGALCLVHIAPPHRNVAVETYKMADGTIAASIVFDSLEISADQILLRGTDAENAVRTAVANGTVALSAQLQGLSRQLHRMTSDYLLQRVQFDRPLASLQSVRHSLADLHVEIELSAATWRNAATAVGRGLSESAQSSVSAAKARCSDTALAMSRAAIQFHGGFGYTEEADVGLFANSALRWASWLGNAQAHRRNALTLQRQATYA